MANEQSGKVTISFKKATQADIGFLLDLRKKSMSEHLLKAGLDYNDEQHLARINEYFSDTYLLYLGQKAIGIVKLGLLPDRWHIRQFQILPTYHGKGIGTNVLKLIQAKAAERNVGITLNVLLKNPALQLYQRMGFQVIGENNLEYQMKWQVNANNKKSA